MAAPESIKTNGWRQGSVLQSDLADRVATPEFPDWSEQHRAVVLSHDCDVVNASYDLEPTVELIRAMVVSDADNLLRHGRNPRRLQTEDSSGSLLDFSIHDRWTVRRSELESSAPSAELSIQEDSLHVLVEWVAKRYTRAAFPDAFNDRTRSANKKLQQELKKNGELITGLFLAISPKEECSPDQNYQVALRVTAAKETLALRTREINLVRTTNLIADALRSCKGIDVVEAELVSETLFTLADLRYFQRWDWDFRTHSGEPGGEIVPSP
ncbi:MAG TPA: hypothetical protein VK524_02170 [Polyangiaceae bacterium]|nr:hypothetical protein [Polyangiaceae bacterium]